MTMADLSRAFDCAARPHVGGPADASAIAGAAAQKSYVNVRVRVVACIPTTSSPIKLR